MRGTIITSASNRKKREVGHTMNANAVALSPPAISRTTPRSQVINDTIYQLRLVESEDLLAIVEKTTEAVMITCRL